MVNQKELVKKYNTLEIKYGVSQDKLEEERELRKELQKNSHSDLSLQVESEVEKQKIQSTERVLTKGIIVAGIVVFGLTYGIHVVTFVKILAGM